MSLYRDNIKEVVANLKHRILPPVAGTLGSYDGIDDPLEDQELLTPDRRGSMLKDTNGKLYYPSKNGFARKKDAIVQLDPTPGQVTLTDTTAVALAFGTGTTRGIFAFNAYQSSGLARTISLGNAGKTIIFYSQALPTGVLTQITPYTFEWPGDIYAWLDAAGGASQYINVARKYSVNIDTTL